MNTYLNVLRQYARFGGRARRREYWTFVLVNTLVGFGLTRLAGYLSPDLGVRGPSLNVGTVLYWVFTVATAAHPGRDGSAATRYGPQRLVAAGLRRVLVGLLPEHGNVSRSLFGSAVSVGPDRDGRESGAEQCAGP